MKLVALVTVMLVTGCLADGHEGPEGPKDPQPPGPPGTKMYPDSMAPRGKDDDEDCGPPRTGREWVCRIDHWDPDHNTVVRSVEKQECADGDMCFLGPLISYPLKGPWEKRWMCGPTPCKMKDSSDHVTDYPCKDPMATCELGPYKVWVNSTEHEAHFCKPHPPSKPTWVPYLCSVNSSRTDYKKLKDCEGGETCGRGPIHFWHEATQYRAYMCTKTPNAREEMEVKSPEEKLMYKMKKYLGELAENLIMKGHVTYGGDKPNSPMDYIFKVKKHLPVLKGHIGSYMSMKMEYNMRGDMEKFALPGPTQKALKETSDAIMALRVKMAGMKESEMTDKKLEKISDVMKELMEKVMGEIKDMKPLEVLKGMSNYLKELREMMEEKELTSDYVKKAYMKMHMQTMKMKTVLGKLKEGDPKMEIMKDAMQGLQMLWDHVSESPVKPDVTPMEIMDMIHKGIQDLHKMLSMAGESGEADFQDMVDSAKEMMEKLAKEVQKGNMKEGKVKEMYERVFRGVSRIKDRMMEKGHDTSRIMKLMKGMQKLWNFMTDGPVPMGETPEGVVAKMLEWFYELQKMKPREEKHESGDKDKEDNKWKELFEDLKGWSSDDGPEYYKKLMEAMEKLKAHFLYKAPLPKGPEEVIWYAGNALRRMTQDFDKDDVPPKYRMAVKTISKALYSLVNKEWRKEDFQKNFMALKEPLMLLSKVYEKPQDGKDDKYDDEKKEDKDEMDYYMKKLMGYMEEMLLYAMDDIRSEYTRNSLTSMKLTYMMLKYKLEDKLEDYPAIGKDFEEAGKKMKALWYHVWDKDSEGNSAYLLRGMRDSMMRFKRSVMMAKMMKGEMKEGYDMKDDDKKDYDEKDYGKKDRDDMMMKKMRKMMEEMMKSKDYGDDDYGQCEKDGKDKEECRGMGRGDGEWEKPGMEMDEDEYEGRGMGMGRDRYGRRDRGMGRDGYGRRDGEMGRDGSGRRDRGMGRDGYGRRDGEMGRDGYGRRDGEMGRDGYGRRGMRMGRDGYGRRGMGMDGGRGMMRGPREETKGDKEPCPEEFWMETLPKGEEKMWASHPSAFWGPEMKKREHDKPKDEAKKEPTEGGEDKPTGAGAASRRRRRK